MADSTAVEKAAPAQVPDLVRTPALEITAEDVALPRIYFGQYMSEAVKHKLVDFGDVFTASGPDDPDPQVLWKLDSKDDGPLFHVLSLRKGKSYSENGGELQLFDYDDPNAPAEAWVTYKYTVALPEIDEEVPYQLLLTKTGRNTARQINTVLKKNEGRGPAWATGFRLTCVARENAKGEFVVARVAVVNEPPAKAVKASETLALMIAGQTQEFRATGEEPAI